MPRPNKGRSQQRGKGTRGRGIDARGGEGDNEVHIKFVKKEFGAKQQTKSTKDCVIGPKMAIVCGLQNARPVLP